MQGYDAVAQKRMSKWVEPIKLFNIIVAGRKLSGSHGTETPGGG